MNIRILLWVSVFLSVLIWSAIGPADRMTWWMEVIPALAGFVILVATRNRFPMTGLVYTLILIHAIILMVGGHYTYAEVPLFDFIRDLFDLDRNNYDKLGHFFQGFVPALLAREILLRKNVVNGRAWLNLFIVSLCLAFSAFYELIEWWVAIATGDNAEAFLGTQGYVWDTQSDMALALVGAITSIILLSGIHDTQLQNIKTRPA